MRHLTIRLQLAWLTFAAVTAFVLVAALHAGGVVDAHFSAGPGEFRASLRPDDSIETMNLLRAQLAADMVFLIAYGLLLRQSIFLAAPHAQGRWARRAVVAVMCADAIENLCALTVVRALAEQQGDASRALFVTMNAAAAAKWALAGAVMLFLAGRWRLRAGASPPSKTASLVICTLFAAGGMFSLLVAASVALPLARSAAAGAAMLATAAALLLQFRLLDMFGVMLRFAYLARVPFVVLFVVAAFGPLALGPANSLLGGILDVASAWGIGVVTAASLVLAFACGTQINLVRAYGSQRTFDPTLLVLRHRVLTRAVSATVLVAIGSLLFCITLASSRLATWQIALGMLAGVFVGLLFLFVVEWISARQATGPGGRTLPQLVVPFFRAPLLGSWLRDAHDDGPRRARPAGPWAARPSVAGRLFGQSSGYVEEDEQGRPRLLRGHAFATVQLLVSATFYAALVSGKLPGTAVSPEAGLWIPTAASLVLLLLVASWALAGLTFFLDRYRAPLVTGLAAVALITGTFAWTDHRIETRLGESDYTLATPGEVLRAFPQPIVVAAAGGGIQAGAWTARALEGIDEQLGGTLAARLALVSSVSGGSMGALYYGAYQPGLLTQATARAMEPSLDAVASALISADLLRVLGLRWGIDRGEALERSWTARLPAGHELSLRAWSQRARRVAAPDASGSAPPPLPAFLFNAAVVETGQPVAFATTQFPTSRYRESFAPTLQLHPVVESVVTLFGLTRGDERVIDTDLQVASAARVSAAFPYVSPAATLAISGRPRYHLVDGGYYDNYGLLALAQWLDDALEDLTAPPPRIDVLIIRGLVGADSELARELRAADGQGRLDRSAAASRGWAWQLVAPAVTFLNTRTFGQWAGGNQVLKLLEEKWARRGVAIAHHLFDYPVERVPPACRAAPLSWKLSAAQQDCIRRGWEIRRADGSALWAQR